MCNRAVSSRRSEATGVWEREQVQDPPLHLQIQGVHLVIALDHRLAALQVAAGKRLQGLLQQPPALGAGLLDLALNGARSSS